MKIRFARSTVMRAAKHSNMRSLLKRTVILASILLIALLALRSNPEPWDAAELSRLTTQLNEAAAISVPHDFLMDAKVRAENAVLFAKVEAGTELSDDESQQYRLLFQSVLHDSQRFLATFDRELSVLSDHAMNQPNNIAGQGIAGHHDHHDLSARKNFSKLLASLAALDQAGNPASRMFYANAAQKDLVDLISHLGVAPHTVSVGYSAPDVPWSDALLGESFEAMVVSYKQSQLEPINSQAYWNAVDNATASYTTLILQVQDRIWKKTNAWERRIAGRFNAIQTFAPPVDLTRPLRRK
jgi:hypothetical protein